MSATKLHTHTKQQAKIAMILHIKKRTARKFVALEKAGLFPACSFCENYSKATRQLANSAMRVRTDSWATEQFTQYDDI
jgi:hypothetical protein